MTEPGLEVCQHCGKSYDTAEFFRREDAIELHYWACDGQQAKVPEPARAGDDLGELPSHLPADAPFTQADVDALLKRLNLEDNPQSNKGTEQ